MPVFSRNCNRFITARLVPCSSLLRSQTICYRCWGQGIWTDYGREIRHRLGAILTHDA